MFGLLQSLGVKRAKEQGDSRESSPLSAEGVINKSSVSGNCLPETGKQLILLAPWDFNSTGPSVVVSVNVQPGMCESSLVKISMFKLNP